MCRILIYGCHRVENYSTKNGTTTIVFCRKENVLEQVNSPIESEIHVSHDVLPETREVMFLPWVKEEIEERFDADEPHQETVEVIADYSDDEDSDRADEGVKEEMTPPQEEIEEKPRPAKRIRRRVSDSERDKESYDYVTENGRLKCTQCQKTLKTRRSYRNHMKLHKRRRFECEICSRGFSSIEKLERHMRVHTGKKPFLCELCSRSFDYRHSLDVHMRSHTKERPYSCHLCTKTYTTKGNLNLHLRAHAGVKMFVCEICGKSCDTRGNLRKHMEIHNDERLFECKICQKTFLHPASRDRHLKSHTGEKKHKCDICSKAFMRRDHAKNHMALHIKKGKDRF